jgi:glycosyltransferase involved in cell wall biosynthesis
MEQPVPDSAAFAAFAPYVDAPFYRAGNPDVAAAGADPAEHYWTMGWREGRDPNSWFQTDYYLRANPDVRASGHNPLWHFLVQGRREGRLTRPAGAPGWRDELERSQPSARRPMKHTAAANARVLQAPDLRDLLIPARAIARGFVVAFSHDRYLEVPGGTQLLIADEQRKFNGDGAVYLHLSPELARLGLAAAGPEPHWLNVIVDGAVLGVATAGAVAAAVADLGEAPPRLLVVHGLHGHRPEAVAEIARALRPRRALFWVHDYAAACANPQLLRNDIAFCGAPPPGSLACRVCVHGPERADHQARLRALFRAVNFHVVAPSGTALEQWRRAAALPASSHLVHPHVRLRPAGAAAPADTDAEDTPVRVAFVGQPLFRKGWSLFGDLLLAMADSDAYRFFHFASASELAPIALVTSVAAETSPANPFGTIQALTQHRIDLVLALSPWPETFGYVAHEAVAAGADIIALAATGHIAELVRGTGRGLVLDDAAALLACFTSRRAAVHARQRRAAGTGRATLLHTGSSATLGQAGDAPPVTTDPDLHLVVDGERLDAIVAGDTWRFGLPEPRAGAPRTVRLRSRHMRPLWDNPDSPDIRRLGVAVTGLMLDGARVDEADPRRVCGWHAAEPGWHWTDGDATLAVGAARSLDVSLVRIARYWHAPLLGTAR